MVEIESDNKSVESGSCTCSDYNSDCSWFYDSKMLGTSYMRFCILCDKDNIIIKKESSINMFNGNSLDKINRINELKKDLNINENDTNERKNVIKLSNISSNKKNEKPEDKSKSNDKNIIKHSFTRIKDKISLDLIDNNNINRFYRQDSNISSNFRTNTHSDLDEINLKTSNFFPENLSNYEHNNRAPIELIDLHDKKFNLHRSPILYPNKRKNIFNINNKNDKSPKRNLYEPFFNTSPNINKNENNEEKNKIENKKNK